jgi:hypothetical protein
MSRASLSGLFGVGGIRPTLDVSLDDRAQLLHGRVTFRARIEPGLEGFGELTDLGY